MDMDLNNNTEIEKALKEFELKEQEQQVKQAPKVSQDSDAPKMVQLVMKWFGLKEQRQAEYALLGFVILAIGVSLYLVFRGVSGSKAKIEAPPGKKIIYSENEPPRLQEQF